MVEDDTGCTKVLDWSGGPSSDSGNSSLLPRAFHCGPVPREELLTQLGDSRGSANGKPARVGLLCNGSLPGI